MVLLRAPSEAYGLSPFISTSQWQLQDLVQHIIVDRARRVKGFHQRSAQYEQILKKNEQMFALLAVTTALCPAALSDLNETVLNLLQEK
jgi:RNA polymerase I-associated factor PAF67